MSIFCVTFLIISSTLLLIKLFIFNNLSEFLILVSVSNDKPSFIILINKLLRSALYSSINSLLNSGEPCSVLLPNKNCCLIFLFISVSVLSLTVIILELSRFDISNLFIKFGALTLRSLLSNFLRFSNFILVSAFSLPTNCFEPGKVGAASVIN